MNMNQVTLAVNDINESVDQPFLWREAILNDPSGNKIKLYWAGDNRLNPPWRIKDE